MEVWGTKTCAMQLKLPKAFAGDGDTLVAYVLNQKKELRSSSLPSTYGTYDGTDRRWTASLLPKSRNPAFPLRTGRRHEGMQKKEGSVIRTFERPRTFCRRKRGIQVTCIYD
ncbi:hypothetical protein MKZ38_010280 [Zalerion maritima]|uniref:Uncharacterized protein n=1 Tax=Zalerion maritima TaxID=339359 RepID=A0AAD5WNB1_9PEZI|nr:hypothetical protein MKZ38_010280 [Zalerion maritima]